MFASQILLLLILFVANIFHPVRLRCNSDGIHNDVKCLAWKWSVCAGPSTYITPARSLHSSDRTSHTESLCKLQWQYSQEKVKHMKKKKKNMKKNNFTSQRIMQWRNILVGSLVGFASYSYQVFAVELQWLLISWVEIK